MIATLLTGVLLVTAMCVVLSLADSAVRWRHAFAALTRERSLVRAGYVPQIATDELRPRPSPALCRSAIRPFARRLPQRISSLRPAAAV